ncbi:MAG: AIR carboxylase family protein, partial [Fibrobacteria bacterium]
GALPSVVAGLVDKPVIGVPTSIGYGASMRGMAALLAILNSCAAGLTVVNIDNGFGAGFAAAQMLRLAQKTPPKTKQGKSPRQRVAKQAANRTTGKPAKKTAKRAAKSH